MNGVELKSNTKYDESEIVELIRQANPTVTDTKMKWLLFDLERAHTITKIGAKKYITCGRQYSYNLSENASNIDAFLSENYPEIKYVIWESTQLNEWMNFLLSKNVIFVEVESELKDYVFNYLQEQFGRFQTVLLSPDAETLSRYIDNNPIVVSLLFSRSPLRRKDRKIALEKLIVDLFSDKLLLSMIGTNDREEIASGITRGYSLNTTKALAYARRRRCVDQIRHYLEQSYD